MAKTKKSHTKKPHKRTGHMHTFWYNVHDANGDIIYDAYGRPLKEKRQLYIGDILIHNGELVNPNSFNANNEEEKAMLNTNVHTNPNGRTIKRGELYFVKKVPIIGSEQIAGRPALVVSTDRRNGVSPTIEVVYLTTRDKLDMEEHIGCSATGKDSTILCEQISTVSIDRVGDYITTLTPDEMADVETGLLYSLGMEKYLSASEDVACEDEAPIEEYSIQDTLTTQQIDDYTDRIKDLEQSCREVIMERDFYKSMYEKLLDRVVK